MREARRAAPILVAELGAAAAATTTRGETRTAALTEDERVLHVLSRFTPGATPELVAEVRSLGVAVWFARQLQARVPETDALREATKDLETLKLTTDEIAETYVEKAGKDATEAEKREARRRAHIPTREVLEWVLARAVYGANAVRETSCDFFRNHLSVSIDKGEVERQAVVDWEREVILGHALGRFPDMLVASARHPAMLFFLDNHLSRRPPSEAELARIERDTRRRTGSEERAEEAVDIARHRGINENYARELMELHTLGVDEGYTQADVIEVAKCFTGWTIKKNAHGRFVFDFKRGMHVPGDKTFLGHTVSERSDHPESEAEEVLALLAACPRTAHFLALKLCRFYVDDEPDPALVKRIAAVFERTRGDVPKVLRAILEDREFFAPRHYRTKFKRPWEYVVSALRATKAEVRRAEALERHLAAMSEALYRCPDPTGYYDQAEAWRDPGALAARWTFAGDLVAGRIGGVRVPASFYADLPRERPAEWRALLERKLLPVSGAGERVRSAVDALVAAELAKTPHPAVEKLAPRIAALLLGSPEFQKQ